MSAASTKRAYRIALFAVAGTLAGLLLFVSPWGRAAEERFGLAWLFTLRGAVTPPGDVLLIAIDKDSSQRLGVPYDTARWSRELHTRLIRGLSVAGARSVTFDLHFRRDRELEDPAFAAALRDAGNVVALEFLSKEQPDVLTRGKRQMPLVVQRRSPPTPLIAEAVVGYAPFTLPKVPDRVSRFWTFDENAGSVASLPVLTLLVFASPACAAPPGQGMTKSRSLPSRYAELGAEGLRARLFELCGSGTQPASGESRSLLAVSEALTPPTSRYLNLYGPAQTVRTISYADALTMLEQPWGRERFRDKAVFIGVSSPVQWELRDEFRTVFSDPVTGMDLSGSEILASAFANLLAGHSLWVPDLATNAAVIFAWALVVALAVTRLRAWSALLALGLLSSIYLFVALRLFATQYVWLPTVVPLVVLGPLMLLTAAFLQVREARNDLARIRQAFGHYLPQSLVSRLVEEGHRPLDDRRSVFGVCLVTDAEGYTSVAEKTAPEELVGLVNDYLGVVIGEISRHGGEVSDIKGDSVMAFWASRQDDRGIRAAACRAGVDILAAVERWNESNRYAVRLPTRIGVHCGQMVLARVGAEDHYEQRAVGDIVNTTSRLEQLNKDLGTWMLVSAETVQDVEGLVSRNVGCFVVKGRTEPVVVHQAVDWVEDRSQEPLLARPDFDEGRQAYERGDWKAASAAFQRVQAHGEQDPVAAWYLASIARRQTGAR